jgi:hypothetical protein
MAKPPGQSGQRPAYNFSIYLRNVGSQREEAMKLPAMLCASCVAMSALVLSAGSAAAQNNYTCWAFVTFEAVKGSAVVQSGFNPLVNPTSLMTGTSANPGGGFPVSGLSIEVAASNCHANTRASFAKDTVWGYTPAHLATLCASHKGETVTVWAIDRFKEIAETPQLYNRVAEYKVTCTATGAAGASTSDETLAGDVKPF